MFNYFFGPVAGTALTSEPALFALLITFAVSLVISVLVLILVRRYRSSNPLAAKQLNRLGQALLWFSVAALLVCGFFYEGAIFTRRMWPYLMLLPIYGTILYAMYFYFTRYPDLERVQQADREKRRKYIPAPHTLGPARASATPRTSDRRRRRRARR